MDYYSSFSYIRIKIGISNVEIIPIMGSVCSHKQLKRILNLYKVETIYHAAAYKHVPLVELREIILTHS